jgi:hypothetical protein
MSQTGTDIENPSGDNVHDMVENNISKYRSDSMVEGRVIAAGCSAINMSSLQPLSKLFLTLASPPKRENRMIFIVLTSCQLHIYPHPFLSFVHKLPAFCYLNIDLS